MYSTTPINLCKAYSTTYVNFVIPSGIEIAASLAFPSLPKLFVSVALPSQRPSPLQCIVAWRSSFLWHFSLHRPSLPTAKTRHSLSIDGFLMYLCSPDGSIFNPEHKEVFQDMSHPLCHYFISSSHNTYLMEDQLRGQSSVEGYIRYRSQCASANMFASVVVVCCNRAKHKIPPKSLLTQCTWECVLLPGKKVT